MKKITITKKEYDNLLKELYKRYKELEIRGLREAKEWKDKYFKLKQWKNYNYTYYEVK